jgi:type I site-specific restriction endonuclease
MTTPEPMAPPEAELYSEQLESPPMTTPEPKAEAEAEAKAKAARAETRMSKYQKRETNLKNKLDKLMKQQDPDKKEINRLKRFLKNTRKNITAEENKVKTVREFRSEEDYLRRVNFLTRQINDLTVPEKRRKQAEKFLKNIESQYANALNVLPKNPNSLLNKQRLDEKLNMKDKNDLNEVYSASLL